MPARFCVGTAFARACSAGVNVGFQCIGDCRSDLALDREDVGGGEFPVVGLRPDVRVGRCVDKLDGDSHAIAGALHAAFENARHPELLRDLLRA